MLEKRDHPLELDDPEGEGIYIRASSVEPEREHSLRWVSLLFFGRTDRFRDLDIDGLFMGPGEDGETYEKKRFRVWHGLPTQPPLAVRVLPVLPTEDGGDVDAR